MSTTITIGVVDQVLTLIGTPVVSSGGKNEDYVSFTFDETWNGFAKIAVFYRQTKEIFYALINDDNVAVVPSEVIATSGIMYLGVVGVNDDTTITKTSQVLPYRIVGGALDGFKPEPATPDVFEQMLSLAQEMRDLAEEIKQRQIDFEADINEQWEAYKTAMNQAESERVEAEIDRTEAESSRVEAESARVTAEQSRATAEQGRATAETARVEAENARASAEQARVTAEQGRVTAENGRVSAESTRVNEWATLKTDIEQTLQSGVINDEAPSATTTYSGNKIDSLVGGIIDDSDTTATDSTWSAQKIQNQINLGDYEIIIATPTAYTNYDSGRQVYTAEMNNTFQDGDIVIVQPLFYNDTNLANLKKIGGWIVDNNPPSGNIITLKPVKNVNYGEYKVLDFVAFIFRKKGA